MSVYAGQAKISRASRDLVARWRSVKGVWRDEVSRRFEDEHIMPLLRELRSTEAALTRMTRVMNQIRRECE
jgi:hypothetical protein